MRAVQVSSANVLTEHTNGVWSIPRGDLNGMCSDYYSAHFMEGEKNFCTREVDLSSTSDCSNILNAQSWISSLNVYAGRNPGSDKIEIEVGEVFKFDSETGYYTSGTFSGS